MFNDYFGFRENPFNENHNIDYFYLSDSNKKLYRDLFNDIYQRVNLTLFLADCGVGKTAFLQQLNNIDPSLKVMFYNDVLGNSHELIDFLCSQMAIKIDSKDTHEHEMLLAEHLSERHQQGLMSVLIVDDAHKLQDKSLVRLLQLSGQRINEQPLIQVILAAVPEFLENFDCPALLPYKATISRQYQLDSLTSSEVKGYIYFRLQQAGCELIELFSDPAVQLIVERTKGVPELINKLCSSALLIAMEKGSQTVDLEIIAKASEFCYLSEPVEIEKIDKPSDKEILDPPIISCLSGVELDNDVGAKKPHLLPKFTLLGSTAVIGLALFLAAIMMLLKTNLEQWQKQTKDVDLPTVVGSKTVKETDLTKSFVDGQQQENAQILVAKAINKQTNDLPFNRHEISTKTTSKSIKPNITTYNSVDKNNLIRNEKPNISTPTRKPVLTGTKSPQLKDADAVHIVDVQEINSQKKSKKNLSRELKPITTRLAIKSMAIAMPEKIDEREQEAKNRASARLSLKQSGIEFSIKSLMKAAETGDNKTLELLLTAGIPPDIQEPILGMTALDKAASNGNNKIVRILLSRNAIVDLRNFEGRTALMVAAGNGHIETLRMLINNGANADIRDHDGWTALMFAAYSNHFETVNALLQMGASDLLKNSSGRTVLQIARSRGHQQIIDLVSKKRTGITKKDGLM